MTDQEPGLSRYAVASIVNAVAAIEDLAVNGTRSLAEVSSAVGVSKSSAFRTLATLADLGYVTHEARGAYRLASNAFKLASHILEQFQIDELARPVLEELRRETGETVNLGLLRGRELVYILVLESHEALRTAERRGALAPLHASALGKSVLSRMEPRQISDLLPAEPMPAFTDNTITSHAALMSELTVGRQLGYVTESEEYARGVACVATPLTEETGVQGAISVSVPLSRFPAPRMRDVGIRLIRAAADIEGLVDARRKGR